MIPEHEQERNLLAEVKDVLASAKKAVSIIKIQSTQIIKDLDELENATGENRKNIEARLRIAVNAIQDAIK